MVADSLRRRRNASANLAPAMMIDDEVYGRLTPGKAVEVIKEFQKNETNQN